MSQKSYTAYFLKSQNELKSKCNIIKVLILRLNLAYFDNLVDIQFSGVGSGGIPFWWVPILTAF